MASPLPIDTGAVFEVYSVGDPLYLYRVINAVSMLSNDGLLLALGVIGLLMGLGFVAMKAVASGGQRVELPSLLVSFLVFYMMFGMTASVHVNDMVGPPFGEVGTAVPTNIDNVPFGVAAAGSLITTIGYELAQRMETAFGTPGDTMGVTNGGFGKSLAWINAVRALDLPEFQDADGQVARYKTNLKNFIAHCTFRDADRGRTNLHGVMVSKDILSVGTPVVNGPSSGGIGSMDQFAATPMLEVGGATSGVACNEATGWFTREQESFYAATAKALAGRSVKLFDRAPINQLDDSFAQIGLSSDAARAYATNMAVVSVWNDALRAGAQPNSFDALSSIMLSQSRQQRATQWGAEESLFKSVMQGFTAFFEGMLYACAPFMALVIGFGSWGFSMIVRYMILSIWVALWLPVLAIINLFQQTVLEHAVAAMKAAPGYGDDLTSIASTVDLSTRVVEWFGVASTLAAATPFLTLSLLFGGAMAGTALAGRLQGGDMVAEKTVTPDVTNTPVGINQGALADRTQAGGLIAGGGQAAIPSLGWNNSWGSSEQSAKQALSSTSDQYSLGLSQRVSDSASWSSVGSVAASATSNKDVSKAIEHAARQAKQYGFDLGTSDANTIAQSLAYSFASNGQLSLGGDLGTPGKEILGSGAQLRGGLTGSLDYKQGKQAGNQHVVQLAQKMSEAASKHEDLKYAFGTAFGQMVKTAASQDGRLGAELSRDTSWQKQEADMQQAASSYQAAHTRQSAVSVGQNIPANMFAQTAADRDPTGETRTAHIGRAIDIVGAPAVQAARNGLSQMPDGLSKDFVAAQVALMGSAGSEGFVRSDADTNERVNAAMEGWKLGGGVGADTMVSATEAIGSSGANADVGAGLMPGRVTQSVERQPVGASSTPEGVATRAENLLTPDGQQQAIPSVTNAAAVGSDVVPQATDLMDGGQHAAVVAVEGSYKQNAGGSGGTYSSLNQGFQAAQPNLAPVADAAAGAGGVLGDFGGDMFNPNTWSGQGLGRLAIDSANTAPMERAEAHSASAAFRDFKEAAYFAGGSSAGVREDMANVLAGLELTQRHGMTLSPDDREVVSASLNALSPTEREEAANIFMHRNGLSGRPTTEPLSGELPIAPLPITINPPSS